MIESKTIEDFLSKVYEALGEMPISEKSDIIVELHDLILKRVQKGSKSISTVVYDLGSPLEVAQKIQLNRSFYQDDPKKKPLMVSLLRWVTLSVGIFSLCAFLMVGAILWNFTAIVKFTENGISLFGGAIQLKAGKEMFRSETIRKNTFQCPIPDYRGKTKHPSEKPPSLSSHSLLLEEKRPQQLLKV